MSIKIGIVLLLLFATAFGYWLLAPIFMEETKTEVIPSILLETT